LVANLQVCVGHQRTVARTGNGDGWLVASMSGESGVSTAPHRFASFNKFAAGRSRGSNGRPGYAAISAHLGLVDSSAAGLLSPGLGNFPMSTTSNFPLPPPVPVHPPAVPPLSTALPGPSACLGALHARGCRVPAHQFLSQLQAPPATRRFQGRHLVTRPPTSLSTSTRSFGQRPLPLLN